MLMALLITIVVTFFAGMGAGLGMGFARMSAAAVITPMLVTFLGVAYYIRSVDRSLKSHQVLRDRFRN